MHLPPIVVTRTISDYAGTINQIQRYTISEKATAEVVKEGLSVRCKAIDNYKALKAALDKMGVTYYTHEFTDHKPNNLVLKGLLNLPLTNIYNELQKLKVVCIKVVLLKTLEVSDQRVIENNHRVHHPSFLVVFQSDTVIKKLEI